MEAQECYICMDDDGSSALGCGHYLHEDCAKAQLGTLAKPGEKFNTTPACCGYCRQWLSHPALTEVVDSTKLHFFRLCKALVDADVVPGLKSAHQDVQTLLTYLFSRRVSFHHLFLMTMFFLSAIHAL